MFRSENFISFFVVVGFFIGLMFSILHEFEPFKFLYSVFVISALFYIIGLFSSSFFVRYVSPKQVFELDKEALEGMIDRQINELDKKENSLREFHYFIQEIEKEIETSTKKEEKR